MLEREEAEQNSGRSIINGIGEVKIFYAPREISTSSVNFAI